MTLEEFKKNLNLRYTFGMRRTDGASRRYFDQNMNIGAELHTSYNEKTMEWGNGKAYYYMENDKRTFESLEELYEAWKELEERGDE